MKFKVSKPKEAVAMYLRHGLFEKDNAKTFQPRSGKLDYILTDFLKDDKGSLCHTRDKLEYLLSKKNLWVIVFYLDVESRSLHADNLISYSETCAHDDVCITLAVFICEKEMSQKLLTDDAINLFMCGQQKDFIEHICYDELIDLRRQLTNVTTIGLDHYLEGNYQVDDFNMESIAEVLGTPEEDIMEMNDAELQAELEKNYTVYAVCFLGDTIEVDMLDMSDPIIGTEEWRDIHGECLGLILDDELVGEIDFEGYFDTDDMEILKAKAKGLMRYAY